MSAPRRLLVIRHAKSDWETDAPTDHARPLNARGRRDAPRVAAELVRRGWLPDLVCASDAARTRETWARMQAVLPDRIRVQHRRSLYHAGTAAVREQAQGWPVNASCIAVVGHNPGWEELIEDLSTWFTLEPGDVIATGTPPGVGFARKPPVYLKAGDVCEVEIDGLGVLRNPVAAFEG